MDKLQEITCGVRDSEIQDILVESFRSTKTFAKVFFPERFTATFSPLHDQIFELIDSGEQRIAIAAPRGIGKTSIVGLALAAKNILFQSSKFLPYVSQSFDSSLLQTENLKVELQSNDLIRTLFGRVKAEAGEAADSTFSKKSWIAKFDRESHGTLVYPRGANQQIRGILYRNARPDLFIFDDFEDPDDVLNEDLRRKLENRFFADFMKAVSRVDKNWRAIYIDTLKHEDALLQKLLDSPDWCSLRLEICDDELRSNAPSFVSDEDIRKEHESHKQKGLLDVFYREFRNLPISTEDAVFKAESFKYFVESPEGLVAYEPDGSTTKIPIRELVTVVIVDPAKTVKLSSADSAVLVIGIHRQTGRIFVRNIEADKFEPDVLLDTMFAQCQQFRATVLAVETTGIDRWISQPIENLLRKRMTAGMSVPIYYSLSASGSKKPLRVAQLAPYYKLGHIYHNKNVCVKLESQLLTFPRPKLWDCMDGLSHVIKVMDEFSYFFDPEDYETEGDPEDEYKSLMDVDGQEKTLTFAIV